MQENCVVLINKDITGVYFWDLSERRYALQMVRGFQGK